MIIAWHARGQTAHARILSWGLGTLISTGEMIRLKYTTIHHIARNSPCQGLKMPK